ncbi:MAG: type II toxin-antitoxin system HicA family toxin [Bryobacteraceae bacterium]
MSTWRSAKARRVLAALKRIGWRHDRTVGSHEIMKKDGWPDCPFSFHEADEMGPGDPGDDFEEDRSSTPRLITPATNEKPD